MAGKADKNIGRILSLAGRLHRARIGERLQALGLFPGQEQVLEILATHGAMSMGELADRLNVRPPTVSKTIARLSTQKLVKRSPAAAGDGRLVRVEITEPGRELVGQLAGLIEEVEEEMLSDLDGKDKRRLRKLLRKIARALAKASGRENGDSDEDLDEDEAGSEP